MINQRITDQLVFAKSVEAIWFALFVEPVDLEQVNYQFD
jgi:hypothetical protein